MAKPASVDPPNPEGKLTLCIDIGGTAIKAEVVDENDKPVTERQRELTPKPATPAALFKIIEKFAKKAGKFDRVSVGFPGVVKGGVAFTSANLDKKWIGVDLNAEFEKRLHHPVRAANDAAVQGLGAISGHGLELIVTLGTGVGCALYHNGFLITSLEIAHHPFRKDKTYEDYLGIRHLEKAGKKKWNKLLAEAIGNWEGLFHYDRLYIGGGNASHIKIKLPENVKIVANENGLFGGLGLWREHSL